MKKAFKKLLSKYSSWNYTFFVGIASSVSFAKIYIYSHLLTISDFATVNYFFVAVGFSLVILSVGVLTRSHIDFVKAHQTNDSRTKLSYLIEFKSTVLLHLIIVIVLLGVVTLIIEFQHPFLLFLAIVHSSLFLLFLLDLIMLKSGGDFIDYAKSLLKRNMFIFISGILCFTIFKNLMYIIYAEITCMVLLYAKQLIYLIRNFKIPSLLFIRENIKYIPVTVLGVLLQFVDRLTVINLLDNNAFSIFSYYSLLMAVGFTIQGAINTRFIRDISIQIGVNKKLAFYSTIKKSLILFFLQLLILTTIGLLLTSSFMAPKWLIVNYNLMFTFVILGALRGSDLISSFYIACHNKKILTFFQLITLIVIVSILLMETRNELSLTYLLIILSSSFIAFYSFLYMYMFVKVPK